MSASSEKNTENAVKNEAEEKKVTVREQEGYQSVSGDGEARMTKAKWLACIALGLGYTTSMQQATCLGAILRSINLALGPVDYYNWMLTASTITTSLSLPLSGGLSDIFGRRWFIIGGCVIGVISSIISMVAGNVPTLIASSAISGFAAGPQQLALAAAAELVPNKHRGTVQAALDLSVLPWVIFGPLTGGAMVVYHGKLGFRINFYVGLALNFACLVLSWFWYHPPSTGLRLGNNSKLQALKKLDWTGVFLLNSGLVLFLVGITLGGTDPWKSVKVLATLIIGGVELILFWLYEWKVASTPFMAKEFFTGQSRKFVMFLIVDFVAGMGLYTAQAFWAQLARGVWEAGPVRVGILSIAGGIGGAVGGFSGGILIGKTSFFKTNLCLIYGTVIKTVADYSLMLIQPTGPHSQAFGQGLNFLSFFATGWTSVSLIVCVQLACLDEDIGMATLILGAVRAVGGSVAVTIYSTLLTDLLKKEALVRVAAAAGSKGLDLFSLQPLLENLLNENYAAARSAPGVNDEIYAAASLALEEVWAKGFHRVWLVSATFSAASVVAAVLSKDVSGNMTDHVAVRLKNEKTKVKETEDALHPRKDE